MMNLNTAKPEFGGLTLFQIAAHMDIPGFPRFTVRALTPRKEVSGVKIRKADGKQTPIRFFCQLR